MFCLAFAGCGPSLVGDDGGNDGNADTSTGSGASATATATADDGPGTSPTTSPSTTANPTVATSMGDTSTMDPTDDGEDDSVDTEGCFFLHGCGFDGGTVNIECDVWAQDCPVGEKCMPWANDGGNRWNATRCSPLAAAPNLVGESCNVEGSGLSGIDDCEISAMCWNVDPATNEGTCVAMCSGAEASPACADGSGTECMIEYDGVVPLCLPLCDPLLQDCTAYAECVPTNDAFFCVPDLSGAAGFYGDACQTFDACDPGYFCADPELVPSCVDVGCCTAFCDVSQDPLNACGNVDGVECLPWYDEGAAPPGYELLGACALPS